MDTFHTPLRGGGIYFPPDRLRGCIEEFLRKRKALFIMNAHFSGGTQQKQYYFLHRSSPFYPMTSRGWINGHKGKLKSHPLPFYV